MLSITVIFGTNVSSKYCKQGLLESLEIITKEKILKKVSWKETLS